MDGGSIEDGVATDTVCSCVEVDEDEGLLTETRPVCSCIEIVEDVDAVSIE